MWRCAKALYIVPVAAIAALAFTTVETVNATESEHLSKGSEFVANNERECIENCISYSDCTVKPQFPGGEAAYREWLDSFSEPLTVKAEGATYDIDFFFVVTKKGKVADYLVGTVGSSTLNHETKKSLNEEFDRMRESLPDGWTPGEVDGKPVDVCMTVKFTNVPKERDLKTVPEDDDDKVYQVCEKAPEFPGGMDAMMKYLYENIKYPADAEAAGKDGRAIVQFIVKKDGSIGNVEIIRSSGDNSLDTEALRVVKSMPKWKPGMQRGEAVNVRFMIPVAFAPQGKTTAPKKESVITLEGGGMMVKEPSDFAIVVGGALYESMEKIKNEDIESITVVSIDKLPAEEVEKCKARGKKGVIYIELKKKATASPVGNEAVYTVCEKAPEFPGGMQELMKWLQTNIKYPKAAREVNLQGKVIVQFIVDKEGKIIDAKAVNGKYSFSDSLLKGKTEEVEALFGDSADIERIDEMIVVAYKNGNKKVIDTSAPEKHPAAALLAAEAVRVVASMPKWNPGTQGGKAVNVKYMLPISFALR